MITNTETPATPDLQLTEHERAMVAKYEQTHTGAAPQATPNETPVATVEEPEKFRGKSREEILKAYLELEKSRTKTSKDDEPQEEVASQETQETPADPAEAEPEVKEKLAAEGFDFDTLRQEWTENGSLKEETIKSLKDRFGDKIVDDYIEAKKAQVEYARQTFFQKIGGEETWNKMSKFAAENWSEDRIQVFNDAMASGNQAKIDMAVTSLKQDYESRYGTERRLLEPETTTASNGLGKFRSAQEITAAMRDPRYGYDPAYTADVQRRVMASDNFF